MKRAPWLVTALREAGIKVVAHPGWETRGRDFTNLTHLVWHHDASPPGDSPGVPAYMLREMAAGRAGAQLWVDRKGTWHVLASGVAFHAGSVRTGKPSNTRSLGVETDHTTGEAWPAAQLTSLRKGSAVILRRLGTGATGLEFHKSICSPVGRKSDPDGLDLAAERRHVADLLKPAPKPSPALTVTPPVQEDDMPGPLLLLTQRTAPAGNWVIDFGRLTKRPVSVAEYRGHERCGVPFLDSKNSKDAPIITALLADPSYRTLP